MTRHNPWVRLTLDSLKLAAESQTVIGLRMLKFAGGGTSAAAEAELMVTEKVRAVQEIQAVILNNVMGGSGQLAPGKAVAHYRRKVRANRRRLTRTS